MNTLKIVCATLAIFVAGIVTGVVLVRIGQHPPKIRPNRATLAPTNAVALNLPNPQPNPGPAGGPDRNFLQLLDRQMRLSPEQRQQVAKIMADGQDRIRQLRQGIEPDIRRELQATHEEIQKLLSPEQQELFQRLMRQRLRRNEAGPNGERRVREFREPRPGPASQEPDGPNHPMPREGNPPPEL